MPLVPLFRLQITVGAGANRHTEYFATASTAERDAKIAAGWTLDGIICFVSADVGTSEVNTALTMRDTFAAAVIGHLMSEVVAAHSRALTYGSQSPKIIGSINTAAVLLASVEIDTHAKAAYIAADAMIRNR